MSIIHDDCIHSFWSYEQYARQLLDGTFLLMTQDKAVGKYRVDTKPIYMRPGEKSLTWFDFSRRVFQRTVDLQ